MIPNFLGFVCLFTVLSTLSHYVYLLLQIIPIFCQTTSPTYQQISHKVRLCECIEVWGNTNAIIVFLHCMLRDRLGYQYSK